MSPEVLIISESGALLWFIRIHQRFWGWCEISCPLLLLSPPLCPPHWSLRYNSTISSSTKIFFLLLSKHILHFTAFICFYSNLFY